MNKHPDKLNAALRASKLVRASVGALAVLLHGLGTIVLAARRVARLGMGVAGTGPHQTAQQ